MTPQTRQQVITILIGSNDNQTIKFGQLIEYNKKYFFLENRTQNLIEKVFPDPFIKNSKLGMYLDQLPECCKVCFYCMSKSVATKIC